MTLSHSSLPGRELYDPLRDALRLESNDEVKRILIELIKSCCTAVEGSSMKKKEKKPNIPKDDLIFWIIVVGRLMFEAKSADIRVLALDALESAVPHIRATNYLDHSSWGEFREIVSKEYTSLLDTSRSEKDPNWHRVWSVLVRIVDRDLCQGSTIINMFLSIVEAGFRSPELTIREQSFDCWRLLVEIFANNKQINIPKRVKLICIPLKSSKSKTESIALKKFDIWWYLLSQLRAQLDSMIETIFEPFIYFCFGPSFKAPLCYYFDESYQELGAPGKMYQSIKQLAALALIHLLGPAPEISKTLLNYPENNNITLTFEFPQNGMAISDVLFSTKAKFMIDSCIECTVLIAQMKHLDYMAVNRCVWNNLINRIKNEKTVPKHDMLQWIKDCMNALLKLCLRCKNDLILRDLLYDTLLSIVESDLLNLNIGYDSTEQLMFNYQMIMSFVSNSQLPCPEMKAEEIINYLFDLRGYSGQNAYWDMLHKTTQYLCHNDQQTNNNSSQVRTNRTRIYALLCNHLAEQIRDDLEGFSSHQTTVMQFLLYPLEYDQLLMIENVKERWIKLYDQAANVGSMTREFKNTLCEMIKAMTVAKHSYNLAVLADFFCYIMRSLSGDFQMANSPVKVLELFKDVSRKGLAYKSNLDRVEEMVCCFREFLEKLSVRNMLTLVLPIRNAINELVANENGLAMNEVKKTLKFVSSKMVLKDMATELTSQSKDVKWNYKMLLKTLLDLPDDAKRGWKTAEMKKRLNSCDDITSTTKTPTRAKADDEFVVIEKVWKFKPETLTEHQREKMMEKRTDIPALYNDMSQSQDSFVIKPWTPSKCVTTSKQELTNGPVAVATVKEPSKLAETSNESNEIAELPTTSVTESDSLISTTTADNACESKTSTNRLDKENNNGNVQRDQSVSFIEQAEQTESEDDKMAEKQQYRRKSVLEKLRIDTVEGKTLDVMNLSRTRRSEMLETRTTRRKSMSSQGTDGQEKRNSVAQTQKVGEKSASASKVVRPKASQQPEKRVSRKLLKFENDAPNTASQSSSSEIHSNANVSKDVIESSQSDSADSSSRRASFAKPKAQASKPVSSSIMKQKDENAEQNDKNKKPEQPSSAETADMPCPVIKVENKQEHDKCNSDSSKMHLQMIENESSALAKAIASSNTAVDSSTQEEIRVQIPSTSTLSEQRNETVKSCTALLSPSRRSPRLSLEDNSMQSISKLVALSPKKMLENKNAATSLYSPTRSIHKQEIKGTPSKRANDACNNAMREALQIATSVDSSTNEIEECSKQVENRSGLSSPKVARFSPLVVVEPIANVAKTLQEVEEHNPKDISHPSGSGAKQTETSEEQVPAQGDSVPNVATTTETENNVMDCAGQLIVSVDQPTNEPSALDTEQLSPAKNLDEEMEPLNKSLNRSIVSSPDRVDMEDRNADLLNSTLNISPIAEEKGTTAKSADSGELAGSADRRSSGRVVGKERETVSTASNTPLQTPLMSRRSKLDPTPQTPSGSNSGLKARLQQQTSISRSPRTSMIGMGGRGAQLINLVRNQQNEQSPKPNTPPQNSSTPKAGQSSTTKNRLMMRKIAIVGNAATSGTVNDSAATALETLKEKEENEHENPSQYLVFSKVLPSPQASPAGSILKRRHNQDDSTDDIESPVNKRKRVSFHDPPVSHTKEYIRQVEECRSTSVSRSLQLPAIAHSRSMSSTEMAKILMTRKSKSHSISELQNFTNEQKNVSKTVETANTENAAVDQNMEGEEEELTSSPESLDEHEFMMHDGTDNMTTLQVSSDCMDVNKSANDSKASDFSKKQQDSPKKVVELEDAQSKVHFNSEEAIVEHVMNRYTLDDILERYIAAGKTLDKTKTIRTFTKELSSKMSEDDKIRDIVLDELSERHSEEFLDHAIQENSNAKVCERLSALTMMDHVFKQLRNAQGASTQTEKNETVVENIYENLLSLPNKETGSKKLMDLREQLLKQELARKSRLEIMSLLENYFKTTDSI